MNLTELLTSIANAIRTKKGTTASINAQDFPTEISTIKTGTDVSDTTAVASNVDSGKIFYLANGSRATGTSKKITPSGTKSITSNGTHDVTSYASANVNVPAPSFKSARVGLSGWDHNTIDLGAPCKAGYVDITSSVGGYNNASYKKEIISVSNDNSSWTVKISHGSNPRDSGRNTAYYARIDGFRYIKYEVEYSNTNLEVSSLSYSAMI